MNLDISLNNSASLKDSHEQDLLLFDAYSLASTMFLFSLVLIISILNKSTNTINILVLIILFAISIVAFFTFSYLMFDLEKMERFRNWLSYPRKKIILWKIVRLVMWISLPIVFIAGLGDALSKDVLSTLRLYISIIGSSFLIFVPLFAVLKLRFSNKRLNTFNYIWPASFSKQVKPRIQRYIDSKKQFIYLLLIMSVVAAIQLSAIIMPKLEWLPNQYVTSSFLKTLWQVHASILGMTVIVVTIIVTIIANDRDRTTTWKLYLDKTKFVYAVWFNLIAIISEGIALLQTNQSASAIFPQDKVSNLIITEGILLVLSVIIAGLLFYVTTNFLNDDYIDNLENKRILKAIPRAFEEDFSLYNKYIGQPDNKTNGH